MSEKQPKTTKCVECGKEVSYFTKKPKWCKACKKKQPKVYRKKKTVPQTSKKELLMRRVLNEVLPTARYIDGGYYSFLKSPKGFPMQLDRYYPKLHLAWEYDGGQHRRRVDFMQTEEEFEYLQKCDRLKTKLCKDAGITLLRIGPDAKITKEYILNRLKMENLLMPLKKITDVNEE